MVKDDIYCAIADWETVIRINPRSAIAATARRNIEIARKWLVLLK